jgi:DNA-binding HxlR family transcriptional regulator
MCTCPVQIPDYPRLAERRDDPRMPDYASFCPVALASGVIADRWTPLILRELFFGSTRFNDIARGLPGISRSLLVQRLKHLERKGVIERWPLASGRGHEYRLTPAGADLESIMLAMGRWAIRWLYDDLRPHEVDAVTLMWWMHRRVDHDRLPPGRVVVQFDHTHPDPVTLWLVFERGEVSVCIQHPGFETDVLVRTSTEAPAEVFQGYDTWARAVTSGRIEVSGPPRLVRALPNWFLWSMLSEDTLARREHVGRLPSGPLLDARPASA